MTTIMTKRLRVYRDGREEVETAEVVCGRDFCARCGECLFCTAECSKSSTGEHLWVQEEGRDFR